MCCFLGSPLKIQPCDYLIKKIHFYLNQKKKNSHGKILRGKPKDQHLSTILKSYPMINMSLFIYFGSQYWLIWNWNCLYLGGMTLTLFFKVIINFIFLIQFSNLWDGGRINFKRITMVVVHLFFLLFFFFFLASKSGKQILV